MADHVTPAVLVTVHGLRLACKSRLGEPEVVRDLLAFLDDQIMALAAEEPEGRLAATVAYLLIEHACLVGLDDLARLLRGG